MEYLRRVSPGAEGDPNLLETLQKPEYGFRDKDFFKLKVLALIETKYTLTKIVMK